MKFFNIAIMNLCNSVLLWLSFCLQFQLSDSKVLSEYISHYEGLTYDTQRVHNYHTRVRRSTDPDATVHVKFKALGQDFHLRLKRDRGVFADNLQLELPDGKLVDHDVSYFYNGQLKGNSQSHVHGSIIAGTFAGVIHTPKGSYYIEKAENYFTGADQGFHSVIYKDSDIIQDPHRSKREARDTGSCGASNYNVQEWMDNVQNSAINTGKQKRAVKWDENLLQSDAQSHQDMYSAYHNMEKRATSSDSSKRTCTLFLQSDPYLWKYMTDSPKLGLGYDDDRALEEITSLFGLHVKGIKTIYEGTRFSYQQMNYQGFSFVVRRIKIMKYNEDCLNKVNPLEFCKPHIDVTNFLNLNSLTNHDEFCLAYVFTYRDFTGGTLGLAWVGAPTRASGGICERYKEYAEDSRKISKSLNTGIVTLVNYNSRVPPKVSTLTFAHEVGHNFGSPHDSGSTCTPFTSRNEDGNYIMFASATSGERPNNSQFSPCSIGNMTLVVDAVINAKNGKENCFVDSQEAYCGNNIVEKGEVCDCGFEEDCTDNCCHGRPKDSINPPNDGCTLKTVGVSCSPSQGPCCFSNCSFKGIQENCLSKQQCTESTNCDGHMAQCPEPPHIPNGTLCNENTQICASGECQGTICSRIEWLQCYLTAPVNQKEYDKGNLCFVACENPVTNECVSSSPSELALAKDANSKFRLFLEGEDSLSAKGIKLPPGAPCDNFQGYCDVFQKCRGVNADGPLARLKNLLFSEETLNSIRVWIVTYWYGVLLMAVFLVVFMGFFIHCCSVHTPSSNPNKAPARKISFKPQRNRQQGPPPGYPAAAPSNHRHGSAPPPSSRPPPYHSQQYQQYEMKPGHHHHGGRV